MLAWRVMGIKDGKLRGFITEWPEIEKEGELCLNCRNGTCRKGAYWSRFCYAGVYFFKRIPDSIITKAEYDTFEGYQLVALVDVKGRLSKDLYHRPNIGRTFGKVEIKRLFWRPGYIRWNISKRHAARHAVTIKERYGLEVEELPLDPQTLASLTSTTSTGTIKKTRSRKSSTPEQSL